MFYRVKTLEIQGFRLIYERGLAMVLRGCFASGNYRQTAAHRKA
jgi:hypothetical protein